MDNKLSQTLAQQCTYHLFENDAASKHLDIKIVDVLNEEITIEMVVKDFMLNGHETCHGGQIFSLADSAFAFACNAQNQAAVAASCHIDFILPAYEHDRLTAVTTQLYQGLRTGIYQVKITNQNNQLIALFKGNSARIKRNVLTEMTSLKDKPDSKEKK
jgi:acyl-CoA thioesterase